MMTEKEIRKEIEEHKRIQKFFSDGTDEHLIAEASITALKLVLGEITVEEIIA